MYAPSRGKPGELERCSMTSNFDIQDSWDETLQLKPRSDGPASCTVLYCLHPKAKQNMQSNCTVHAGLALCWIAGLTSATAVHRFVSDSSLLRKKTQNDIETKIIDQLSIEWCDTFRRAKNKFWWCVETIGRMWSIAYGHGKEKVKIGICLGLLSFDGHSRRTCCVFGQIVIINIIVFWITLGCLTAPMKTAKDWQVLGFNYLLKAIILQLCAVHAITLNKSICMGFMLFEFTVVEFVTCKQMYLCLV